MLCHAQPILEIEFNFIYKPSVNNEMDYNNLIFKDNSNIKDRILLNKKMDYSNFIYLFFIFGVF